MEFTQEVKDELCNDIEMLKKMLDKLSAEIKDIEKGKAIEFIPSLMQVNRIDTELHGIRSTLQDWQAEGTEYSESP